MKLETNYVGKANVNKGTIHCGNFTHASDHDEYIIVLHNEVGLFELKSGTNIKISDDTLKVLADSYQAFVICQYYYNKEYDLYVSNIYEEHNKALKVNYLIENA
jgi:hypothetical protein